MLRQKMDVETQTASRQLSYILQINAPTESLRAMLVKYIRKAV